MALRPIGSARWPGLLLLCALFATPPALAGAKRPASTPAPEKVAAPLAEKAEAPPQADPPLLHVGDEAPVFSGALHNPKEAGAPSVSLSALVGPDADDNGTKAVLVSFFATWCAPCKKELPFLAQLSRDYRAQGLRIVSVAIDKDEARWPEIAELVKEHAVDFPVVKDRYNLIARRWLGEKTTLPSVFLVGRDGLVKLVKQGYTADAAGFLRGEVDKALGGGP